MNTNETISARAMLWALDNNVALAFSGLACLLVAGSVALLISGAPDRERRNYELEHCLVENEAAITDMRRDCIRHGRNVGWCRSTSKTEYCG